MADYPTPINIKELRAEDDAADEMMYCHASCCSGETGYRASLGFTDHDAQMLLDQEGYPFGYFADDHLLILDMLAKAYNQGYNKGSIRIRLAKRKKREGKLLCLKTPPTE